MLDIREADGGVTLRVRVHPRSSREGLGGERSGALLVRLTATPAGGEANEALVRYLGKVLGRPPSALRLVRGAASREKILHLSGLTAAVVRERLAAAGLEALP